MRISYSVTSRTWFERLFTRPWRPWEATTISSCAVPLTSDQNRAIAAIRRGTSTARPIVTTRAHSANVAPQPGTVYDTQQSPTVFYSYMPPPTYREADTMSGLLSTTAPEAFRPGEGGSFGGGGASGSWEPSAAPSPSYDPGSSSPSCDSGSSSSSDSGSSCSSD